MSKYVDTKSLMEAMEGSFEQTWAELRQALPEDATLVATFPKRVLYEREGKFFGASYTKRDNKIVVGEPVGSAYLTTFDEDRLGIMVGRSILEAVDAIMDGGTADLTLLSKHVSPNQRHFAADFIELAEEVLAERDWTSFYQEHRKDVRKVCHGKLGIIEGALPTRRFSKLRGDLKAYEAQIKEAVDLICSLASEAAETLKSKGDLELKEDLVSDALEIRDALWGLGESASAVHMRDFVNLIDRSCDRMKDLLVMAEYISISEED